eukprot:2469418-Alexandrium_andersonii.AAC.1
MGVHVTVPVACQYPSLPATASSLRVQSAGISRSPTSRSPRVKRDLGPVVSMGSSMMKPHSTS